MWDAPSLNDRVKSKLMLLVECERIDRHQLESALAFRGWCEAIGRRRTSAWLALRVDGGRRPEGVVTAHQIDAAQCLHNASLALGPARMKLLY